MSLGAGIFEFLSGEGLVGDRIYPLTLPQDVTLPAITYQVISDAPTISHSTMQDVPTHTGIRHSFSRVQFNCYGETYDDAEALCDDLDDVAVGFRGLWGDVEIGSVVPDLRLDDLDEQPRLYRVIRDLIVSHTYQPGS
jgi:hypothetical protein